MQQQWRDDFNLALPLLRVGADMWPTQDDVDRHFKAIVQRMSPSNAAWLLDATNVQATRSTKLMLALKEGGGGYFKYVMHVWHLERVAPRAHFATVAVAPLAVDRRRANPKTCVIDVDDGTDVELAADDLDGWACAFDRAVIRHSAVRS